MSWGADMPQFVRRIFLDAVLGAALIGLVAGFDMAARAQYASESVTDSNAWARLLQSMGLKPATVGSDINYTERSPLVVPPTRDLPPPQASAAMPPADWPKDPAGNVTRPKPKPGLVPGTAVETPNPPHEKKPWYNPTGWFDKEEYAKFAGEPARQSLTDPPAGYRIPSADQPYGLGPEKKGAYKPSSKDFNLGPATSGGQ